MSATEKYFPDGIDPRIAEILRLISQLARGNLDARGELSPDVDDLDGVLQGLNMLAEELSHTMVSLQQHRTLNAELQAALEQVKTLRGLLPICSHCKKIRDSSGYWTQVEEYFTEHTEVSFSHGVCATCLDKYYPP